MSITPVPISIRLVRAPTAARSGNGEASWRGELVDPVVRAVDADLLGRHRQVDGLQQRVGGGPRLGLRRGRPVAERQETDVLHDGYNKIEASIFPRVALRRAYGASARCSRRRRSAAPRRSPRG